MFETRGFYRTIHSGITFALTAIAVGEVMVLGGVSVWLWCLVMQGG
jgi:uncharacterized membrane protein